MTPRTGRPPVSRQDHQDWYDWAVVYRYWNRDAEGLRLPYRREQAHLLRLAAAEGLTTLETAERLGVPERTIMRWRSAAGLSP